MEYMIFYLLIATLYGGYDLHSQLIPFPSFQECEKIALSVPGWNFDPQVRVTVKCVEQ